jgi:hypothetical protein
VGQLADSIRTLWAERALAWLKSQGGRLSLAFLNSFGVGGPGAAFTKDMPTEVFSRVGENFIRLLRGEIVWDASTSPVFELPPSQALHLTGAA